MSQDFFSGFSSQELQSAIGSKLFRDVLDTLPVAVAVLNTVRKGNGITEFVYTYANKTAEKMAGTTLDKKSLFLNDDAFLFNTMAAVVESGRREDFLYHYQKEPEKWIHYSIVRFDDGVMLTYENVTERKKAAILLQHEKQLMDEAQAISHTGSFEWDLISGKLFWSDEMYRIHGMRPQETEININLVLKLIHPEDHGRIAKKIDFYTKSPGAEEVQFKLKLADGKVKHVSARFESFRGKSGKMNRISGLVHDITEKRTKAEELRNTTSDFEKQAKEKEQREASLEDFKRMIENSSSSIISIDKKGFVTTWNPAAEKLYGYSADEAIGRQIANLIVSEENKEIVAGIFSRLFSGEPVADFETVKKCRGGSQVLVSVNLVPLKDHHGKISGIVITSKNITQHEKTQELEMKQFLEQTQFIQGIASASADILYVMTIDTKEIIYANHAIAEILGYDEKYIKKLKNPVLDIMIDADVPSMIAHIDAMKTAADDEVREIEYRMKHADGSIIWFRDRNTVFKRDEAGVPVEKLGICQNINERKVAEENIRLLNRTLRDKNRELQSLNNEMKTFTSIAAYDYKETLQTLYTNLEFIISRDAHNLSNTGKANLRKAQTAIQKMKLLTDDIVAFSRLQNLESSPSPIDLNLVLKNAIAEIQEKIDEVGAEIEAVDLPKINGFPLLIDLLFFHLISNAVKFRRNDEKLHIQITYHVTKDKQLGTDMHQISIIDNGIGIAPDETKKVFEMFYRNPDKKYRGSGIGLAICKKIADLHGGTMAIESELGKGTTVCCFFPMS